MNSFTIVRKKEFSVFVYVCVFLLPKKSTKIENLVQPKRKSGASQTLGKLRPPSPTTKKKRQNLFSLTIVSKGPFSNSQAVKCV